MVRRVRPRTDTGWAAWRWAPTLALLLALLGGGLLAAGPARAAGFSIPCGDTNALIAALVAANANGEADTITLAAGCTYQLTTVNNMAPAFGANGLPVITGDLTIVGNGATIRRAAAPATPAFRLLHIAVGSTGIVELRNLTIAGGSNGYGGGIIINGGTVALVGVTVSNNTADIGGGIAVNEGTAILTNATVSDNTASNSGGGLFNSGADGATMELANTTISNNTSGGYGGGLSTNNGTVTLKNSTISQNTASAFGGGFFSNGGTAILTNTTVSANSSDAFGGGLYNDRGMMTLTNVTVQSNIAGLAVGGLITTRAGTTTLRNTIVATAAVGANGACETSASTLIDDGGNLQFDADNPGSVACGAMIPVGDPLLAPLADNGGPTRTRAPLAGSPARGLGLATTCAAAPVDGIDQRGVARPQGIPCDSGAYQTVALAPATLPGATVGAAYSQQLNASGGSAPYTIGVSAGPLPPNLTLGATGVLSGTPTAGGTFTFTITAADNNADTATRVYTLVVARATQTITFATPTGSPSYTAGDTFAVGATASSGLPVTFAASGACAISGTTVTTTQGGTCTVTASQPGDATYAPAPDVARAFAVAIPRATVRASTQGNGAISPAGDTTYPTGGLATYTATPATGQLFLGWTLDGVNVGFASPLEFTVDTDRTLVARFAARPAFADVAPSGVAWDAITQLAARGVIKGYPDGTFYPGDTVQRAQIAAFLVRALGWDTGQPGGPAPFSDLNNVDPELARAIAILAQRGIAKGYGDGTYDPTGEVTHAQAISLIARSLVQAGYWQPVTAAEDDGTIYPNVPRTSDHRLDLLTFVKYAGAIPARPTNQAWADWQGPASRGWTAQVLWQALSKQFGVDRVP